MNNLQDVNKMKSNKITTTLTDKCLDQMRGLMLIYKTDNKNEVIERAINEVYCIKQQELIKEVKKNAEYK